MTIKLPLLPDRTPVKVTLALNPDLMRDIQDYAELYRETYGQKQAEPVTEILPFIVRHYLDNDKDFTKSKKRKVASDVEAPVASSTGTLSLRPAAKAAS